MDHVYQQDYSRNLAMRRVGSTQGAIASVAGAEQRKTATEVDAIMSAANGMFNDAVDRFAEPFAQLFSMMWTFMARHARAQGGRTGLMFAGSAVLDRAAWAGEYCNSTGVSGRSVNQHRTLASLTNMGQLAPVLDCMTQTLGSDAVTSSMLWIFNTVDTELARRIQGSGVRVQDKGEEKNAERKTVGTPPRGVRRAMGRVGTFPRNVRRAMGTGTGGRFGEPSLPKRRHNATIRHNGPQAAADKAAADQV